MDSKFVQKHILLTSIIIFLLYVYSYCMYETGIFI